MIYEISVMGSFADPLVCTVKKDKLIKLTKYLSKKKSKRDENEIDIEENEENVKIYFVKHLI